MKLYFAYGSNMNVDQFDGRCPKSTPESGATLRGYRLIINQRGVATLAKNKKAEVEGALYNLDPKDDVSQLGGDEEEIEDAFPTCSKARCCDEALGALR